MKGEVAGVSRRWRRGCGKAVARAAASDGPLTSKLSPRPLIATLDPFIRPNLTCPAPSLTALDSLLQVTSQKTFVRWHSTSRCPRTCTRGKLKDGRYRSKIAPELLKVATRNCTATTSELPLLWASKMAQYDSPSVSRGMLLFSLHFQADKIESRLRKQETKQGKCTI